MVKLNKLLILILVLFVLFLTGCSNDTKQSDNQSEQENLTQNEAIVIITNYFEKVKIYEDSLENLDKYNSSNKIELKTIINNESYELVKTDQAAMYLLYLSWRGDLLDKINESLNTKMPSEEVLQNKRSSFVFSEEDGECFVNLPDVERSSADEYPDSNKMDGISISFEIDEENCQNSKVIFSLPDLPFSIVNSTQIEIYPQDNYKHYSLIKINGLWKANIIQLFEANSKNKRRNN